MTFRGLAALLLVFLPAAGAAAELPERIVLMWQVDGRDLAEDLEYLSDLGVNAIHSFALGRKDEARYIEYMDAAERAELGVIAYVGLFIESADDGCRLSKQGEAFVNALAEHPALLAWHTVDEPADHQVSRDCQLRLYDQVKSLDPVHPVMLSLNFTRQGQYDEYFDERAFDLLDLHKYVNPIVSGRQRRLLSLHAANRRKDYPVIVTLRAFNSPHKIRRLDLQPGGLRSQYRFFFAADRAVTKNVGFYGWRLAPNRGLTQIDWMKTEFEQVMREQVIGKEQ